MPCQSVNWRISMPSRNLSTQTENGREPAKNAIRTIGLEMMFSQRSLPVSRMTRSAASLPVMREIGKPDGL